MKSAYLLLVISIFIFSCSSDDQENQEVPEKNFYALTVGNTWVYKYYTRNETTDEFSVFAHKTDSVKIVGTKVFNNITYYEFYTKSVQTEENGSLGTHIGEFENTSYMRDSSGSLVSSDGRVHFWNNNYQEILRIIGADGFNLDAYAKLNETFSYLTIEAGFFECYNLELYARNSETNEQYPTASNIYYSDGVGNVCEIIGALTGVETFYERRLVSFSLK